MRIFAVILFIISIMSCSNPVGPRHEFVLGDTVSIKMKETVYLQNSGISIKFDDVLEDSRCPIDVMCFWEGNASVSLIFLERFSRHDIILNTYSSFGKDTTINNYKITLIDVHPYPESFQQIDKSKYSVDILLELFE